MKHEDDSKTKFLIIPKKEMEMAMENARILKEELYKFMGIPKNTLK